MVLWVAYREGLTSQITLALRLIGVATTQTSVICQLDLGCLVEGNNEAIVLNGGYKVRDSCKLSLYNRHA